MHEIDQVRGFNRAVTRRIGLLRDKFLGRGRPFGEARLVYEIGSAGIEIRELRRRLDLDSGYVSRLLRSLEGQGLVDTLPASGDARVRCARLTSRGLAEYEELNRRSDSAALSILAPLGASQRERLVAAMAEVENLLLASDVVIKPEPAGSAAAQWCLRQYFELLGRRFEAGYDPGQAAPAGADDFTPPRGIFLLARALGNPVGCGALKRSVPDIGEIKRLWVASSLRGLGVGQKILDLLEAEARKSGLKLLRLDTNKALREAEALYRKNGYREVPPFNDDPYPDHWFEKRLD